jgi:hypothetical protein
VISCGDGNVGFGAVSRHDKSCDQDQAGQRMAAMFHGGVLLYVIGDFSALGLDRIVEDPDQPVGVLPVVRLDHELIVTFVQ